MHKYAIRYKFDLENDGHGYAKEEAGDKGLTDCILGISILLPETGEYSQAVVVSYNGKEKRPLTQKEIFKSWLMMGLSLHDTGELQGWQADFVKMHSEMLRSMFNHSDNCAKLKGNRNERRSAKKRKK